MKISKRVNLDSITIFNFFCTLEEKDDFWKFCCESINCDGVCTECDKRMTDGCQNRFRCENEECGRYLNFAYLYIVHKLQEKNLLPKNFKKLCCYCYAKHH